MSGCKKSVGTIVEGHQHLCDNCNQDGAVYKGDVEDLCGFSDGRKKENLLEGDFSLVEVPSQGTDSLNFSLEQVHPHPHLYYVYCIHPSHQEVEIDGETWCLEQESRNIQLDKSPNASSWKVSCHDEKIIYRTKI